MCQRTGSNCAQFQAEVMKKAYLLLLTGLLLLLFAVPFLLISCKGSLEADRVEEYLVRAEPLIDEATQAMGALADLLNNADKYGRAEIEAKLREDRQQYDDIIDRFTAIDTPQECVALRGYTTDGLDNMGYAIDYLAGTLFSGDPEYFYDAFDSYDRAMRSMAFAATEWDRLASLVSEEGGVDIGQILLGLLGLAIAGSLAIFVLNLVFGTGLGVLYGVGKAVGSVWKKATGRRRRNSLSQSERIPPPPSIEEEAGNASSQERVADMPLQDDKDSIVIHCGACGREYRVRRGKGIHKSKCPHCERVANIIS